VGSNVLVEATVGVADGTNVSFKSITTGAMARLGPGLVVVLVVLLGPLGTSLPLGRALAVGTAVLAPVEPIVVGVVWYGMGDIVIALGDVVLDDTRSEGGVGVSPIALEQFAKTGARTGKIYSPSLQ
jgi:hypothetical protein